MDILFHAKSKNTYEEYKKYAFTFNKKRMILTIVLLDIFFVSIGTVTKNYFFYIFAAIVPLIEYFSFIRPLKKVFYTNKLAVDAVLEYDFYETYFTKTSAAGNEKIEYSKLLKIVETKTNFYLMIALNQGYILKKDDMPEGLGDFLKNLNIKE